MTAGERTAGIKALLEGMGADAWGVAPLAAYDRQLLALGEGVREKYPFAISFGLLVPKGVLETLTDGPTLFYLHHYRQVNYRLDTVAYELARALEAKGAAALPFAASQMVDWQGQRGHISHKHVAAAAGLGWIGRNNLLVHPRFGARLRLNTVLTDMDLSPGALLDFGCGRCAACGQACPVSSIAPEPAAFDHKGCYAMLQEFKNKRNLGHHICGLCVRACGGKG